jgi:hypothetical protein
VDADRVREAMQASMLPDNRVVLVYVPAEAPPPEPAAPIAS